MSRRCSLAWRCQASRSTQPAITTENHETQDLQQFSSIEDAFDETVDRRIDGILAGGLDEWIRWFKRKGLDIQVERLATSWAETVEVFQRRHIIVHNGGLVSRRYVTKMRGLIEEMPPLGQEMVVDEDYIRDALDILY